MTDTILFNVINKLDPPLAQSEDRPPQSQRQGSDRNCFSKNPPIPITLSSHTSTIPLTLSPKSVYLLLTAKK